MFAALYRQSINQPITVPGYLFPDPDDLDGVEDHLTGDLTFRRRLSPPLAGAGGQLCLPSQVTLAVI